jgi:hypothetical protein
MSKYLRLKTLLDKLALVAHKAQDHANADATAWTRSTQTMPWILWFGKPGAYTHVTYIIPRRIGHVKTLETDKFTR